MMCVLKLFSPLFVLRICLCNSGQDLTPGQLKQQGLVSMHLQRHRTQHAVQPSVADSAAVEMQSCSAWAEPSKCQMVSTSNKMRPRMPVQLYSCHRCGRKYRADKVMSARKEIHHRYSLDDPGNVVEFRGSGSSHNPEDIEPGVHSQCRCCLPMQQHLPGLSRCTMQGMRYCK